MEAPDFELKSHAGDTIRLSEYRGRHNVLVVFFPQAWTPV
jgi:peroxiredoxin